MCGPGFSDLDEFLEETFSDIRGVEIGGNWADFNGFSYVTKNGRNTYKAAQRSPLEKQIEEDFAKRERNRKRAKEKEKHAAYMREWNAKKRAIDPVFLENHREYHKKWMQEKRQDPSFKEKEKEKTRKRKAAKRKDPAYREQEKAKQREYMRKRRAEKKKAARTIPSDL